MSKEELQALWDELLIKCWRADMAMNAMVTMFLMDVKPELLTQGRFKEFKDFELMTSFISGLGLRRCRDRAADGELEFNSYHGPVRAFVANRCQLLNNCLWNKDNTAEHLIESISAFKWVRKVGKLSNKKHCRRHYARLKEDGNKLFQERTRSPAWDQTK